MIRLVRHWLRLPLLTQRERRNLNGFWWAAGTIEFPKLMREDFYKHDIPLDDKSALVEIINEFMDAIEWIEGMKA